jgi:hypothetical protein
MHFWEVKRGLRAISDFFFQKKKVAPATRKRMAHAMTTLRIGFAGLVPVSSFFPFSPALPVSVFCPAVSFVS